MSKRKILTLAMTLAMVAILAIGGTMAYFTDTDNATNKFTVSTEGVEIKLIEQQRGKNEDGTVALVDFTQNKKLYPINGSAQGTKDKYGLPTAENYVDKIVTVQNLKEDAYVRVYIAVPAALENSDPSKNVLHWNIGNKFTATGDYTGNSNTTDYTANMGSIVQLDGTTTIEGIEYNVYYQTYKKALIKDEVTGSAFMVGLYLDKNVDFDGTDYTINGQKINFNFKSGVAIPVFAVGAQADGFTDADAAINAAFGENYNPWNANA